MHRRLRRCVGDLFAEVLDFDLELGVFTAELIYGVLEFSVFFS